MDVLRVPLSTVLLLLLLACISQSQGTVELKYALFTSGPTGGFDSSGAVPAIELAEEMVNQNNSVLSGYTLTHTDVKDTECDRTRSLDLFFDSIPAPHPTVLGLLGCGCSIATTPVAEIVHHKSISQISYSSASIELSDRSRFPNFFRTYTSDADFTPAITSVLKFYGWKRIAVLTQREDLFIEVHQSFNRDFRKSNITVRNRMIGSRNLRRGLNMTDIFFEEDSYRVFFLNMYSDLARQILCEAYQRGFSHPRYVWLTYGWYQDRWWTNEVNPETVNCSDSQLAEIVERGLALQVLPKASDPDMMTDTALTPNEFYDLYQMRLETAESRRNGYTYSFGATLAYDALWTLALALDKVNDMIATKTTNEVLNITQCARSSEPNSTQLDLVPLENFTYTNTLMGCVVRWCLEQTDFVGLSGPVRFDKSGSRVQSEVRIFQYRTIEGNNTTNTPQLVLFAETETININVSTLHYVNNESNGTVFPATDGSIPSDGTAYTVVRTLYLELVIIYYILATLGLVFCTVCLIFNFSQRKKKVVRLTSPSLNYLIIAGAYIMFGSIYFRLMYSISYDINAARCSVNVILTNAGYCLTFGTILAKMGRIYYIFHNPTANKKTLKDWHLMLVATAIAGFGFFMGLLHVSIPQLKLDAFLRPDEGYGTGQDEDGVQITYKTYQCDAIEDGFGGIWHGLTYVYFALLQVIGIILAIQTRKVKIKVLNDSKYIAALVYISSIILLLLGIFTYAFGAYINITEILFSGSFLFATTTFLCIIFIPKMVVLYRDPKGVNIFDKSSRTNSMVENTLNGIKRITINDVGSDSSDLIKISQLKLRVAELEGLLRDCQTTSIQGFSQSLEGSTITQESERPSSECLERSTSTVVLLMEPPSNEPKNRHTIDISPRTNEGQVQIDGGLTEENMTERSNSLTNA